MKITKSVVLDLLAAMPDGEARQALIAKMVETRELSEADLAHLIVAEVARDPKRFAELLRKDALLQFLWQRFQDAPEYLARALVRVRPDLFWHYGFAYRLILRLRADLGPVFIPPGRPSGLPIVRQPLKGLDELVTRDLLALDVEHKTRFYLYFFARDPDMANAMLADERKKAGEYEELVLKGVAETFDRLLAMKFPGTVPTLNGNVFPALHVRWWIERAEAMPRVLNIGDTGTYKTSFAFVGLDHFGCKKVLVLCAPNARRNHEEEADRYFRNGASRVQVLIEHSDLTKFAVGFDTHQFHIVGWSALVHPDVVEVLETLPFDAVFVDECQYGKSVLAQHPAARALAFLRIGRKESLKRVLACSATPWENRPEELAAMASIIRPDLFPRPEVFISSGLAETPRILRELFATSILDVELREIRDLPDITPKPWEDLFGAEPIEMTPNHRRVYELLREDDSKERIAAAKTTLLLKAALHPSLVRDAYDWPLGLAERFGDWRLSSKLVWLRQFIDARLARAKVVVGTGIFVSGITRADDEEMPWVGGLLKEWYGADRVLILDGDVAIGPERDEIIRRWREDPKARILLVSMLTCPDSINLTVRKSADVKELWITALSHAWKPWKQFLGRFLREGQEVPIRYSTPILPGTIDEALLHFNREKWQVQRLFRANVPLTEEEWDFLSKNPSAGRLREIMRSPFENVTYIANLMGGRGEQGCTEVYASPYGVMTHGEIFARHFIEVQDRGTSGNVARFMAKSIREMLAADMIAAKQILDAGCGPLTLERTLKLPIFGVDMNPHMIELGRPLSPHQGINTSVGRLSELPKEWSGRFLLTASSLVLDWTSLVAHVDGVPERVHILRELVRVTHPQGQLWLTFPAGVMSEDTLTAWCRMFRQNGFAVDANLTGFVEGRDGPKGFRAWSLLVTPDGNTLRRVSADDLRFTFEIGRMHQRKRRGGRTAVRANPERMAYAHQEFVVQPLGRTRPVKDTVAVGQSLRDEIQRWARVIGSGRFLDRHARISQDHYRDVPWRALEHLGALGILKFN